MEINKGIEALYTSSRKQWREWLENNSQLKKEICLIIYHKKSNTESITYKEAVEEALCFGWIDSLTNKRDWESIYQRFSPRKPASNPSKRNKDRVERLIREGLMTGHGLKVTDLAKQKGKWELVAAE